MFSGQCLFLKIAYHLKETVAISRFMAKRERPEINDGIPINNPHKNLGYCNAWTLSTFN